MIATVPMMATHPKDKSVLLFHRRKVIAGGFAGQYTIFAIGEAWSLSYDTIARNDHTLDA
jgi:hypothetical protein